MPLLLPDFDTVILIHDVVLDTSGGKAGILNEKHIHAAIERPQTYIEYIEAHSIDTICALLIDSIARNHGFNDGNKRTALMTGILTYRMNGVSFKPSLKMNTDFDELVVWVVTHKPSIDEIVERLIELRQNHEGDGRWMDILKGLIKH